MKTPQPTTSRPRRKPTMPPTLPHSRGVSAPRNRVQRDGVAVMGCLLMFPQRQKPAQRIKTRPARNSVQDPPASSTTWLCADAYPLGMAPTTVDELVAQLRDGGSRVTTARRLVLTA